MTLKARISILVAFLAVPAVASAAASLTVKAANTLGIPRPSETLELSAEQLAPLGEKDLRKIHVQDAAGKELLCQAVDTSGDAVPDQVIFQADFAAGETKTLTVSAGKSWAYTKADFKAYGRFVRERFDDFAWENDRVAHRTYGKALETWQREPLTSSAIDIWCKRVPKLVINEWYMVDDYHEDTGEGADFYSAGPSRGVGGSGLWADGKLALSKNFVASRVLANGPIRVMFELTYEPFDVGGVPVAEVKRITLDAGQNLSRFESRYAPQRPLRLTAGVGIKKADVAGKDASPERGWLVTWEPIKKDGSHFGAAVVVDPKLLERTTEDALNLVVLAKVPESQTLTYWAGFGWDRGGHFTDYEGWKAYVERFAQGRLAPIALTISSR